MCPPASPPFPAIGPNWTDKDIVMFLDRAQPEAHVPFPSVRTGINLHEYHPKNLPGIAGGCWYLLKSPVKKETEIGFWKAKGDACHIYSDHRVNGWRSTLEFYEPDDRRTDWVMQEYTINHNDPNLLEGNGSLCRVFFCHGESGDHRSWQSQIGENLRGHDSIAASSTNERRMISSEQGHQLGQLQVNLGNNGEVNSLDDCIGSGDYLELGDLGEPYSSCSSSVNSSRPSVSSNELFDFLEVDDLALEIRPEYAGYDNRIPASSALTEVVPSPATEEGTVVNNSNTSDWGVESLKREKSAPGTGLKEKNNIILPAADQGGSQHAGQSRALKKARNVSLSNLKNDAAAPSSSQNSVPMVHKERVVRKKKKRKNKYFCFMPFSFP